MDNNYLLPGTVLPSDWSPKQHLITGDNLIFKTMLRENYSYLGGWTQEEYHHYWKGERAMERLIYSGKFPSLIKSLEVHSPNHFIHANIKDMTPTVIILCGIPTSGKSTWARNYQLMQYYPGDDFRSYRIISRDALRKSLYGKGYKPTKEKEKYITTVFNKMMDGCILLKKPIILDNTHCKEEYIKQVLNQFENTDYRIKIKFFDIPLWKAYYRNIKRRLTTGKWIPFKVIKTFKQNYDKIDKKKYEHYKLD